MADLLPAIDPKKVYFIKGSTLAPLFKHVMEWTNLEVRPKTRLKLTRGTAKSILEFTDKGFTDGGVSALPFQFFSAQGVDGQIYYGKLYGFDRSTEIVILNLTVPATLAADMALWIHVPIDGATLTPSATAPTLEVGTISTQPAEIEWDTSTPPLQTALNIPVGTVLTGSFTHSPGFDFANGDYHWLQKLFSHLSLVVKCSGTNGPAVYAEPFVGR